ncbi:fumarate hydratase, partial [Methanobrevibacter sp.]
MSLEDMVQNAVIKASTTYSQDRIDAFKRAVLYEKNLGNSNATWALETMIKNEEIARKSKLPLCDDTGIPHVLVELGNNRHLPENFIENIKNGIKQGLDNLPARPMAVKGSDLIRLEQSEGLYDEPSMIETAPISIDSFDKNHIDYDESLEDEIHIHILLLGGGPEIRSKTYRVFHKHDYNVIMDETILWLTDSLKLLGCTPAIPAIGIGRTHYEASHLMLK